MSVMSCGVYTAFSNLHRQQLQCVASKNRGLMSNSLQPSAYDPPHTAHMAWTRAERWSVAASGVSAARTDWSSASRSALALVTSIMWHFWLHTLAAITLVQQAVQPQRAAVTSSAYRPQLISSLNSAPVSSDEDLRAIGLALPGWVTVPRASDSLGLSSTPAAEVPSQWSPFSHALNVCSVRPGRSTRAQVLSRLRQ